MPVTAYSPEPLLRHPAALAREMVRDLQASRELGWRLFVRDVSALYRQSLLGYVWAFLPAIATALPFIFLESQGIVSVSGTGLPYAAFAIVSTLLWQVFVDALQAPLRAVTGAKSMLPRVNFPREALLVAGLLEVLFHFLVRLVVLAAVMAAFRITPGPLLACFPLGAAALVLTGFALGLFLAPLGALYQDVGRSVTIASGVWMLLTPVIYPPRSEGLVGFLTAWNPVSPLLVTARGALAGLEFAPSLPGFAIVTALSIPLLIAGWIFYRLTLPIIIERMG